MSGVKPDPHFGVGLGFYLALGPRAEGFWECMGESVTRGDEHGKAVRIGGARD